MTKRRTQGIALNTIVIAAIAVMVLILIVGFTTGGLGNIFKGIQRTTGSTDLQTATSACAQYCTNLQTSMYLTDEMIKNSQYCTAKFWIDSNRNGKQDAGEVKTCPQLYPCTITMGEEPEQVTCSSSSG